MFVVVLGVVGTGTWALVEGIKSTDGDVQDFWNIVGSIESQVGAASHVVRGPPLSVTGQLQPTWEACGPLPEGALVHAASEHQHNRAVQLHYHPRPADVSDSVIHLDKQCVSDISDANPRQSWDSLSVSFSLRRSACVCSLQTIRQLPLRAASMYLQPCQSCKASKAHLRAG